MLDNCSYNKVKLMHDLSSLIWFIQQHAYNDAQNADDAPCADLLKELETDLSKHVQVLKHMLCEHHNA